MSKSYKFRGEVNHSFSKKKKKVNVKERVEDVTKKENNNSDLDDFDRYSEWEDDGDFEKFTRKKW
tara:strand:+ start:7202 stop:7396 length:195 start_codon:yes stop_codon:yes gene_type:complete